MFLKNEFEFLSFNDRIIIDIYEILHSVHSLRVFLIEAIAATDHKLFRVHYVSIMTPL